jgi:hypothetical protein
MQTSNIPQCYFVRGLYTVHPILLLPIVLISRNSHLYVQKTAANIITNLTLTCYAFSHKVWKDFIFLLFVSHVHFRKCKCINAQ